MGSSALVCQFKVRIFPASILYTYLLEILVLVATVVAPVILFEVSTIILVHLSYKN